MKKGFGLLIMLAIFTFALVSCGGEKKANETADAVKEEVKTETATAEVAEFVADFAAGEEIYDKYCFVCHKDGIAGAPKSGNKELWGPRAEKGMATLVEHVTKGYTGDTGILPPMGTCMECTENDFKNIISFMLNKADLTAK